MEYSYAATSHPGSAVNFSLFCNFVGVKESNLIVVKGNRIEVHCINEEGLSLKVETIIYGRISAINAFRFLNSPKDVLFILTERNSFCVLEYDEESNSILSRAKGNVKDRVSRDIYNGQKGLIDPDAKVIGMFLYEGLLKVVPIENSGLKEAFDLPIEELRHIDVKFMHGFSSPTFCLLYEDNKACRHLNTYVIDIKERTLHEGPWNRANVEYGAHMLIPVPLPYKGVIIVGQTTITYLNGPDVSVSVGIRRTDITACCVLERDASRYLLGDRNGNISLLKLCIDEGSGSVAGLVVEQLGVTSIPETLCSLGHGIVYVGSTFGDSQLVKLLADMDESESYVQILDNFSNIGPVMDMCVVGSDKQEQCQLVTCSGAYKDGSIRVVRSGICINQQASIDIQGIKGVWSLPDVATAYDRYLVQSYTFETRFLRIDEEEMSECEIAGFSSSEPSLHCGNVLGNVFVQVTPTEVRLIDAVSLKLLVIHKYESNITVAVGCEVHLALAQAGGKLTYLEFDPSTRLLNVVTERSLDHDIACISFEHTLSSHGEDGTLHKSPFLTAGLWTDNSVRILNLPDLQEVHRINLGLDTPQIRDVIMAPLSSPASGLVPTGQKHPANLLIGLGNGTLITCVIDFSDIIPSVCNRQDTDLGSRPLTFSCFSNDGALCVLVCGDRPTVVFSRRNNDSLLFSPVNISGEVSNMVPFNSALCPDCLAMTSEKGLVVGSIDSLNKIHVQKYPLGEAPRHICHHKSSATLAVCSTLCRTSPRGEESVDRVLFLDDRTMEVKGVHELEGFENGASCLSCFLPVSMESDHQQEFVIIGTAFALPDEQQPSRGRILVFALNESGVFHLVAETVTKGAVFSMTSSHNRLIAGVDSKVHVYRYMCYNDDGSSAPELVLECGHHGHVLALYVKTRGDLVVVGDLVRSVCLLRYKASDGSLEEIARDFNSNYMRSIEIVDDTHVVGAEDHGNIFVLKRNVDAKNEEKSRLDLQSGYHIGDFVNVFICGSLRNTHHECSETALYGTVSGAIGVLLPLSEDDFHFLSILERSLKYLIKGVGGLVHEEWRTMTRRQGPRNTIDGDLIELFLDLNDQAMRQVTKHVNDEIIQSRGDTAECSPVSELIVSIESIILKVEELAALH